MSDDTSDTPVESVRMPQASAEDASIDMLATITISIERDGHKQEIEFKARPHELECDMESFTIPPDEGFQRHEQVVRVKRQKFRFGLSARPVPDPVTGVAYTITRTPPG